MSYSGKVVLIFAGLWLAIRTSIKFLAEPDLHYVIGGFLNLLFIVTIGFLVIRKRYKTISKSQSTVIDDFKHIAQSTVKYGLFAAVLITIFYTFIHPEYVSERKELRLAHIETLMSESKDWSEYQEQNPALEGITKEDWIKNENERIDFIFKPFTWITLSLIGLVVCAMFYAFFVAVIWRTFFQR